MATGTLEKRLSPLIILALVAALVLVVGLWATDRAGSSTASETMAAGSTEHYEWKLVTTWPKNFPGLGSAAVNLAGMVEEMSNGRLTIKVYGAGELVPALGVFDEE